MPSRHVYAWRLFYCRRVASLLLANFKSDEVRKDDPFEDHYVRGKYGAVPFLTGFDTLNETLVQYEKQKS